MILWWFSRHDPLPAQRRALNEMFPQAELRRYAHVFHDAADIARRLQRDDELVVVAPLSLISKLIDLGITPLWPVMEPTTEDYAKLHTDECVSAPRGRWLRFVEFRRLVEIAMKFEPVLTEVHKCE